MHRTTDRRPRRTALAIATSMSGVLLLGACSSGDGGGGDDRERPRAEETTQETTSPQDLPTVPQIEDFDGARKDVEMGECSTDQGDNTVTGTVTNPTRRAQDYVITVSWVTDRSDVVGRGVAEVRRLAAGEEKSWEVTGTLAGDGEYSCTLNVQRGSLDS